MVMRSIVAPEEFCSGEKDTAPSVFLAGGISGCPEWQSEVMAALADAGVILLNPRRPDYRDEPDAARAQIAWEFVHLRRADAILFWFPCETLCPITLFELGAWSMTNKPLLVGTHPGYKRRLDVEAQLALVRPDVTIADSLDSLIALLREWLTSCPRPTRTL
jgi:hypothetical protein